MYTTAAMSIINPLAYWSLGTTSEQIIGAPSSFASLTNVSYTSTPIINNEQSQSKSLLIKYNSVVDISLPTNISGQFSLGDRLHYYPTGWAISFWFNFNNQLKGSGYGTTPYIDNQLKFLQILDNSGSSNFGSIYYDYLTNTIRFNLTEVSGSSKNTDAYAVLPQFDKSYLVVAEYVPPVDSSNGYGSINVYINGQSNNRGSGKIYIDSTSLFSSSENVKLKIDGSSLYNTSGKPNSFIFTSLAICSNESVQLNVTRSTDGSNQKFNYMYKSAFINGDPKNMSRLNASTSYFDFNSYDIRETTKSKAVISGEDFTNKTYGDYKSMLIESSIYGIRNYYLDPDMNFPEIYSDSDVQSDYSNYTISSSSGIKLSNSLTQHLYWHIDNNIISDISSPNINLIKNGDILGTTLSMQITKGSASSETVFGINEVFSNYGNYDLSLRLYLKYYLDNSTSSWHYTLYLYDILNSLEIPVIDQIFSASSASSNIAISFSNSELTLYTTEGGTTTVDTDNSLIPISSNNFIIEIGNNGFSSFEKLSTSNFTGYIKNVGVSPLYISDFTSYDFAELKFLMTRFTSTTKNRSTDQILFPPSIKGTFIKTISNHLSELNCYIVGSQINWNTMDNCTVSISTDGGNSYSTIQRFQPITMYDLFDMTKTFMVKIDIVEDPVVVDSNKQYFNNLSYYMFKNLGMTSDVAKFTIESSSSKLLSNYTIMDYDETSSVYSRPANFGIKFTGDLVKPQGSAIIKNPSGSTYNAIEMWYRPDYLPERNLSRTNMLNNPSGENTNTNQFYVNYNTANTLYTSTASPIFGSRHWVFDTRVNNYQIRLGFNKAGAATGLNYITCTPGETYTFSFYLKDAAIPSGSVITRLRFFNSSASTTTLATTTTTSAVYTSSWTRIYVTASAPSSTTASLNGNLIYPEILSASLTTNAASTTRCYIDGVMLEKSSILNDYFDGSFAGASWTGTSNNSTSDIYYSSVSTYILNNVSGTSISPEIYVDQFGAFDYTGGKLYINGASYSPGGYSASTISPSVNEMYQLVLVLDTPISDNLYLNGDNLTASSNRGIATYGHLQFWHYQPTEFEILNRFDSYFYTASTTVFDEPLAIKPFRTNSPEKYSLSIVP